MEKILFGAVRFIDEEVVTSEEHFPEAAGTRSQVVGFCSLSVWRVTEATGSVGGGSRGQRVHRAPWAGGPSARLPCSWAVSKDQAALAGHAGHQPPQVSRRSLVQGGICQKPPSCENLENLRLLVAVSVPRAAPRDQGRHESFPGQQPVPAS